MPAEPSTPQSRPPVRRVVQVVAAATLIGYLCADAAGRAVFAGPHYASPAPLLVSAPASADGVGGLVEQAALQRGSRTISSRDLRPAVLALVPRECDCSGRLRDASSAIDGDGVRMYVVGSSGSAQADRLARAAGRGVVPIIDPAGVLQSRYHPGPHAMLLLVRRDGVVAEIVDGVPFTINLGRRMPALLGTP